MGGTRAKVKNKKIRPTPILLMTALLAGPLTAQAAIGKTDGRLVGSVGALGSTPVVLYYEPEISSGEIQGVQSKISVGTKIWGPYRHVWEWHWAPDRSKVAWVASDLNGGDYLYFDDRRAGPYNGVTQVRYLADGTLSYVAQTGRGWVQFTGDRPSETFDEFSVLEVSPDGSRSMAVARQGRGWYFQNGRWVGPFEERPLIRFSPDSSHFAIAGKIGGFWRVLGDENWGPYDSVGALVYSPDGGSLAFSASRDGETYVVENGEERGPYQVVNSLQYSSQGVLGYVAAINDKFYVFVGDQKSDAFAAASQFRFVPGQETAGFVFAKNGAWYAWDGQKRRGPYIGIGNLQYSAEGSLAGFLLQRYEGVYVWTPSQTQGPFESVDDLTVAPGGSLACSYKNAFSQFVVTDKGKFGPYLNVYHWKYPADARYLTYGVDVGLPGGTYSVQVQKIIIGGKEYTGDVFGDTAVYIDNGTIYLR